MPDTNRKLEIYIARNGDVIPGDNGETGSLPGPIERSSFWNDLLPESNPEEPSLYVPNLPPIRGGISERWIKLTRRYNDLVEHYMAAPLGSGELPITVPPGVVHWRRRKHIAFLNQKELSLKSKMAAVRSKLVDLAYMHNETIIMMRALDN